MSVSYLTGAALAVFEQHRTLSRSTLIEPDHAQHVVSAVFDLLAEEADPGDVALLLTKILDVVETTPVDYFEQSAA
ncbi:hypothetical protein [Microbacterium sp. A84]|uniref:hypothetical protein n=1 Tax=Microbacterium sp. A84 TaxID=3450715 RepID=UPI003F430E44